MRLTDAAQEILGPQAQIHAQAPHARADGYHYARAQPFLIKLMSMNSRTRVTTSLVLLAGFALSKWAPVRAVEPNPEIDTVVVCARRLLPAMKPWIEYRRRQGHEISLISGADPPAEIRRAIQTLADKSKLRHVVLVGDTSSVDWRPIFLAKRRPIES